MFIRIDYNSARYKFAFRSFKNNFEFMYYYTITKLNCSGGPALNNHSKCKL